MGEEGYETYSHLPEFLWDGLEEEHCLFDPISLSVLPPTSHLHNWRRALRLREGQTVILLVPKWRGGSGHHPPLKLLQDNNQAELNWNMSSFRRHRSWLKGMSVSELNRPGGM